VKAIDMGVTTAEMKGRDNLPWQDYKMIGNEILEVINHG
jgi:chromosome partitioning protein